MFILSTHVTLSVPNSGPDQEFDSTLTEQTSPDKYLLLRVLRPPPHSPPLVEGFRSVLGNHNPLLKD